MMLCIDIRSWEKIDSEEGISTLIGSLSDLPRLFLRFHTRELNSIISLVFDAKDLSQTASGNLCI
jgi:hypothetical protein